MNHATGEERETRAASPVESPTQNDATAPERICSVCRTRARRSLLIRITTDFTTGQVHINKHKPAVQGRSVYLCRTKECVDAALKGTRLKNALEGRKTKNVENRRAVKWPLEPQLIQEIFGECAEG